MLQEEKRWLVFRTGLNATVPLPLSVRSTGHYHVTPKWRQQSAEKWFLQLFWTISGHGRFEVNKEWFPVNPGEIFMYYPGETHHIEVLSPQWQFCWITFDHKDILRWVEAFGLSERIGYRGDCPQLLFTSIAAALQECTPEGERKAAHLGHELLLKASAGMQPKVLGSAVSRAKAWLEEHYPDPQTGVSEAAAAVGMHRSTLFRSFAAQYGLAPSQFLQSLRLQKALSLLRESDASVQEVALQCGFSDANYFSRSVRAATGLSPLQFRNS